MTHWSQDQLDEYMAKRAATAIDRLSGVPDEGPESVLQGKIQQWAREWGHPCLSFRQSTKARGFLPPGWPDVGLILKNGRVLWVELKSSKGRLSIEQKAMRLQFMHLGHEIHEVRSFKRFLEIVNHTE